MITLHGKQKYLEILDELKIDCEHCCGICCTALYFTKTDGFPKDKLPGDPCPNLQEDFRCRIHNDLHDKNLKGCLAYDCFGAGQKVTRNIYHGKDWRVYPKLKDEMFSVYLRVMQLHQMLGYLIEASNLLPVTQLHEEIKDLIQENQSLTYKNASEIMAFDMVLYKTKVDQLLKKVSSIIRSQFNLKRSSRQDYVGKSFVNNEIQGLDCSMRLLIAANFEGCNLTGVNFLGADARDVNVKHADMSESIFLTQIQANSMIGNIRTILPEHIQRPVHWSKVKDLESK